MRYLITGATGFLGRELLVRMLARGASVLVTTRRQDEETLDAGRLRLASLVERTLPGTPTSQMSVAFSDVTAPDLALSKCGRAWLEHADEPIQIVHGAAEVRFDVSWEQMERQNVHGTRNVLSLARQLAARGLLHRLDHVSTAFVAGDRTDVAMESELDVGQMFRNNYERSKLAAEREIALAREEGLPVTVHRPSIIVGDSRTGKASSFKVLYWPMKVYARGRWRTIFGRPECTVDVVPVDFVADAMIYLFSCSKAVGGTFHLTAGVARQSTIAALAEVVERSFSRGRIRYVDPEFYSRWLRPILRPILHRVRPDLASNGALYLPYFRTNPSFSIAEAQHFLEPVGLTPPHVSDYFEAIVRFAAETDFGAYPSKPASRGLEPVADEADQSLSPAR